MEGWENNLLMMKSCVPVSDVTDVQRLQGDMNRPGEWLITDQMEFNVEKCKIIYW